MTSVFISNYTRFFLYAACLGLFAGCGSDNSTAQSGTGSIAAKLTWSPSAPKASAKTLYAAPPGVTTVKILVSATDMATIVKDFSAANNSGTINGIPVGIGRTVKAQGLDASGTIRYQGSVTGITVNAGDSNPPVSITLQAPVTTASPASGTYTSPMEVTLTTVTSSEPATIYYTTSGREPSTDSAHGPSPLNFTFTGTTTLKFFARDSGFALEQIKTAEYTINP